MDIKEASFPGRTYLVWRKEIEIANIMDQNMWRTAYGKVHEYTQKHNLKITGPGVALYFRWDMSTGRGEIGIGNPVEGASEVSDSDLSLVEVPASNAMMTTVRGGYDTFPKHHSALRGYLKERDKKTKLTIEEYVVTGMQTVDPEKWETNLYYLYE